MTPLQKSILIRPLQLDGVDRRVLQLDLPVPTVWEPANVRDRSLVDLDLELQILGEIEECRGDQKEHIHPPESEKVKEPC